MNIALYRMYYGEDFIEKSIMSIIDNIDKIFVMYSDRPWGEFETVKYKGEILNIPCPIDKGVHIVKQLEKRYPDKIQSIYFYHPVPDNQFTVMYENLQMRGLVNNANVLMLMEPDMIWPENKLNRILDHFSNNEFIPSCTFQVEFWKSEEYIIPIRKRPGAIFYKVSGRKSLPVTVKNGSVSYMIYLDEFIYNYGFCMSPKNMLWKTLIGIVNAEYIGDSMPDENWYEDKWLTWNFKNNNHDLEISKKYKSLIPCALRNDSIYYIHPKKCIHLTK